MNSPPALLSITSHIGYPFKGWDVIAALLYAGPSGDRYADLGANEILIRSPKVLVDVGSANHCGVGKYNMPCLENFPIACGLTTKPDILAASNAPHFRNVALRKQISIPHIRSGHGGGYAGGCQLPAPLGG